MRPRDPDRPEPAAKPADAARGNGRAKPSKNKPPAPAAVPTRSAPHASGPDMKALLQALKRRWLLAATLSLLLGSGAAVGAWYGLAAKYTAFAQLRIAAITPYLVFHNANNPEGRNDFSTYQRTQAAAVKNRYVLNAALKRDDVRTLGVVREQAEPITWLEDEPERVAIEADLLRPGYLVLSDVYAPGWEASVDGVAARIEQANVAFRAVALPATAAASTLIATCRCRAGSNAFNTTPMPPWPITSCTS